MSKVERTEERIYHNSLLFLPTKMSSAAFEAYLGRRRRSADPGCEVGGNGATGDAAVLRRRHLPTVTQPRRQESCPGQVMTAKLAGIAGEKINVATERPLAQ